MSSSSKRRVAVVVLALVATLLPLAAPAVASTKPTLVLTVTTPKIDAGQAPSFTYTTSNLPAGATLQLQRQVGTAKVWKKAVSLALTAGAVDGPKLQLGKYPFRLAVIVGKKIVATSKTKTVYSYGAVQLGVLCIQWGQCANGGTAQVGSRIFTPQVANYTNEYPTFSAFWSVKSTSCRALDLQFANYSGSTGEQPGTAYLEVVQADADPVTATAGPGVIGSQHFTLTGSAFNLEAAVGSDADYEEVDVAGTAECYTTDGNR